MKETTQNVIDALEKRVLQINEELGPIKVGVSLRCEKLKWLDAKANAARDAAEEYERAYHDKCLTMHNLEEEVEEINEVIEKLVKFLN